jgi:hypothetical protein
VVEPYQASGVLVSYGFADTLGPVALSVSNRIARKSEG